MAEPPGAATPSDPCSADPLRRGPPSGSDPLQLRTPAVRTPAARTPLRLGPPAAPNPLRFGHPPCGSGPAQGAGERNKSTLRSGVAQARGSAPAHVCAAGQPVVRASPALRPGGGSDLRLRRRRPPRGPRAPTRGSSRDPTVPHGPAKRRTTEASRLPAPRRRRRASPPLRSRRAKVPLRGRGPTRGGTVSAAPRRPRQKRPPTNPPPPPAILRHQAPPPSRGGAERRCAAQASQSAPPPPALRPPIGREPGGAARP
ncbi:proline-rich proteoglycan 2-like [Mustela nigripes]|uniref:proline-rich proteoglycan 2-like n=1 Tax=Mustela nigripes TaxID=77151 RepID=UPI00281623F9|nr:proline-rich proteoglycan 2-like [Mustela nigripes]